MYKKVRAGEVLHFLKIKNLYRINCSDDALPVGGSNARNSA